MKQITSIYAKQHRKIQEIFETAGSPGRVLCVSMDYAKAKHVALFCNGFGDVFKKPFPVDNLPSGFKALLKEVKSVCKERKIKAEHVFFGGEDNPSYVQNFTQAIWEEGYFVARVNALEAKNQRDNHQASTDELDVFAIAKTLLNKPSYAAHDQPEIILNLKEVSRSRSQFVKQLTKQKLQIHQYVDRLCPGFLDQEKSGVTPFSQPSLALLNNNFSVEQIRRRTQKNLTDFLERNGQNNPQAAAIKLKALATQALAPLTTSVARSSMSGASTIHCLPGKGSGPSFGPNLRGLVYQHQRRRHCACLGPPG
jgi:DNA-binding response OmpR family regulator